jgi:hypothetical protein
MFIVTPVSILIIMSAMHNANSMDSPLPQDVAEQAIMVPKVLPASVPLRNPENEQLIAAMWSKLRDFFRANKPEADEFWWQTAVDHPDRILERFLEGNQRNLEQSVHALIQSLRWRRRYGVRQLVYSGEQKEDLIPQKCFKCGKGIFWGYDKEGYLVIVLYPRKHEPWNGVSNLQNERHIVYQTELGRRLFKPGRDKVTVLVDLEGLSMWSMDLHCAMFVASTLRYHYPDAINQILLINMNWVYVALYKMVQAPVQFIVNKLRQVADKKELLGVFEESLLLTEFGGKCKYKYEYVKPESGSEKPYDRAQVDAILEEADSYASRYYVTGDEELKMRIKECYERVDRLMYPGDLYRRIGVVSADGSSVDWTRSGTLVVADPITTPPNRTN